MKILLASSFALLVALAGARATFAASAAAQPGVTGVPAIGSEAAEQTCISCHNSSPLNPDTTGTMTLEGVPERYEAGKSYTLTLKIAHTDPKAMRWGFQMTAIAMKDGSGGGEFVVTDPVTTQILMTMTGTRSYISHGYQGTGIGKAGGMSWTFQWKAPASDAGVVGFFAAANVANADGSNQGDRIYAQSPKPLAETRMH